MLMYMLLENGIGICTRIIKYYYKGKYSTGAIDVYETALRH